MYIRRIEMTNFRQFKNMVTIDFSTDETKNVTVIMGDNGTGKTTLAQAFVWALYGENDFKVKELINREVRDGAMPGDEPEVKVSLFVHANGKEYVIIRKQRFVRTNRSLEVKEEKFNVGIKDNVSGETVFKNEAPSRVEVKQMMPQELSRYFFFDGERIRAMSEEFEKGKSKEFAEAVHGLIGLTAMKKAMEHFKTTSSGSVIGKFEKNIDDAGDEKLKQYTRDIQIAEENIEKRQNRVDELDTYIEQYNKRITEARIKINAMMPQIDQKTKYDAMLRNQKSLQDRKIKETNALFSKFSNKGAYYMFLPLAKRTVKELSTIERKEKSMPGLSKQLLDELLRNGRCLCGEELKVGHEHYVKVSSLYATLEKDQSGSEIRKYSDQTINSLKMARGCSEEIISGVANIRKIDEELEELGREIDQAYQLLTDTSKAKEIKSQLQNDEDTVKRGVHERESLIKEIGGLQTKVKYIQAEKDKLIKQDQTNRANRRYLEYARYVYELMKKEYEGKETAVRGELEQAINNVFQNIYDGGIRLEVDERYHVKVVDDSVVTTDDELERNTAQNYAIIFAFISGIIQMSKNNQEKLRRTYGVVDDTENDENGGYPLVMDAPLSAFDKRRIESICHTIPQIAQQVIIFIKDTDGEVAEEYMSSNIGKRYMLEADTTTDTRVVER